MPHGIEWRESRHLPSFNSTIIIHYELCIENKHLKNLMFITTQQWSYPNCPTTFCWRCFAAKTNLKAMCEFIWYGNSNCPVARDFCACVRMFTFSVRRRRHGIECIRLFPNKVSLEQYLGLSIIWYIQFKINWQFSNKIYKIFYCYDIKIIFGVSWIMIQIVL